jgi:hypothetical protein
MLNECSDDELDEVDLLTDNIGFINVTSTTITPVRSGSVSVVKTNDIDNDVSDDDVEYKSSAQLRMQRMSVVEHQAQLEQLQDSLMALSQELMDQLKRKEWLLAWQRALRNIVRRLKRARNEFEIDGMAAKRTTFSALNRTQQHACGKGCI